MGQLVDKRVFWGFFGFFLGGGGRSLDVPCITIHLKTIFTHFLVKGSRGTKS